MKNGSTSRNDFVSAETSEASSARGLRKTTANRIPMTTMTIVHTHNRVTRFCPTA